MKIREIAWWTLVLVLGVLGGCAEPSGEDWRAPMDFHPRVSRASTASSDLFRQRAVDELRADESLVSLNPTQLPGLAETFWIAVAESPQFSRAFALGDDHPTLTLDQLRDAEAFAIQDAFGRMTPELYYQQSSLSPDDRIRVNIFIRSDAPIVEHPYESESAVSKADLEDWIKIEQTTTRAHLDVDKQEVRSLLERSSGVEVAKLSGIPVIDADIPVWLLRSKSLNELSSVVELHVASASTSQHSALLGYAAHASMNESAFTGGGCGSDCDGDELMIGLWETGCYTGANDMTHVVKTVCAGVASQNTRLYRHTTADYQYETPLTTCDVDADCQIGNIYEPFGPPLYDARCRQPFSDTTTKYCVFDHPTAVAASVGMLGNYQYSGTDVYPPQTGNAPSSVVFGNTGAHTVSYALANSPNVIAGIDWLIDTMPTFFVNRSENAFTGAAAAALNWAARTRGVFYTVAAGNDGGFTTCGDTINGLCVGWYSYFGNGNYNVMSAHRVASESSYINSGNVERPHLLGPGTMANGSDQLLLPNASFDPAVMGSARLGLIRGSSFAAPAVLSAQLQAMEYEGYFSAAGYPLPNKAMILAATVDANNDGAIGGTFRWSGQPADAKDGAGQIDFGKLKAILDNNRYYSLNLTDASFVSCGTGCREYLVGSITMNQRVRVALAWNGCSTSRSSSAFLNNDLDLRLQRSNVCGGSYESNDVYSEVEMLEIAPSGSALCTAGIRIRIKGGGALNPCGANSVEPVAIAWTYE